MEKTRQKKNTCRDRSSMYITSRIDFIGLDLEKHPPMENAVKIVKWSGTFTVKLKLP